MPYILEWFHFCPTISIIMVVLDAMELVFGLVDCFGKDAKNKCTQDKYNCRNDRSCDRSFSLGICWL